jgi:hypothetical protein
MKKKCIVLLVLLLTFLLSVSVLAEGEIEVKSITVSAVTPVKDTSPAPIQKENLKIQVSDGGVVRTLSAEAGEYDLSPDSGWYENTTGTEKKVQEDDVFISGRTYTLRIMFTIKIANCKVDGSTSIYLGSKKATLAKQGEDYELSGAFVCTSDRLAPKVSLTVEGETEKVFDGQDVVLTASVQKDEGVYYSYLWYCNDAPLEDQTESEIRIRNVAQSGEYYCLVTASLSPDSEEGATTESTAYDVTITPLPIIIQIEDAEKNLFDPDPVFTYTALGELYDTPEGSLQRKEGEDLGSYEIHQGTLTFGEILNQNYEIEYKKGTLTILAAGELPFSPVAKLSDNSKIVGAEGAKIRIRASKNSLPEGAMVSLNYPGEKITTFLKSQKSSGLMKCFSISFTDEKGKEIILPKHATLRIQIPLTAEESLQDPSTISAGFYTGTYKDISCAVSAEGVTYIVV